MGSDAEVYLFDHARYVAEVVPTVAEWLRTGRLADQRDQALVDWWEWKNLPQPGTDVLRDCTVMGRDLGHLASPATPDAQRDVWELRRCRSLTCPSRTTCPWWQDDAELVTCVGSLIEDLIVTRACVDPDDGLFVGRSISTGYYWTALDEMARGSGTRLRWLIDALGSRGRLIKELASNSDGIHGWLDAQEASELAEELGALPLDDVGSTFAEVREDHRRRLRSDDFGEFEDWSLAVLRAAARRAQELDRGLLWGNDALSTYVINEVLRGQ